jgi:pantothenate kinase
VIAMTEETEKLDEIIRLLKEIIDRLDDIKAIIPP